MDGIWMLNGCFQGAGQKSQKTSEPFKRARRFARYQAELLVWRCQANWGRDPMPWRRG